MEEVPWRKFMFENLYNTRRETIRTIDKFETVFDGLGNYTADISLITGQKLEYKSWKRSSFRTLLNGDQAKNQLKAYIRSGDFEYVVDYQKLLKDGVADPVKFVREEFQEVFRKNAQELFKQNEDFFISFKIDNEIILEQMAQSNKLVNHPLFEVIIKVE